MRPSEDTPGGADRLAVRCLVILEAVVVVAVRDLTEAVGLNAACVRIRVPVGPGKSDLALEIDLDIRVRRVLDVRLRELIAEDSRRVGRHLSSEYPDFEVQSVVERDTDGRSHRAAY